MKLQYDPGDNDGFWTAVRQIPGFPHEETIRLRRMIFESDVVQHLSEILQSLDLHPHRRLLVVMDATPMQRAGDSLKPLILNILRDAGWNPEALVLEPDSHGQVHTEMPRIAGIKARLSPDAVVLSVGSGVVTDTTKHACYLYEQETAAQIPYVVYQTANSVSAYSSNMAPVFVDGVKRTLTSRYPDALICDLETLRDAPREMTVAGVGDMLAVFTSFPDWYLANRLGLDRSYGKLPETLLGQMDEIITYYAEDFRTGSLQGMAVLAKVITLGGLAMSLTHRTTPLSGYEHVISHILDLIQELHGAPLAQHGSQVALATALALEAYRALLQEFDPEDVDLDRCFPPMEMMQNYVLDVFSTIDPSGKAGAECWSDYRAKLENWQRQRDNFEAFLGDWREIRSDLQTLVRPPEHVMEILHKIEAPASFEQLEPAVGPREAKFAFLNAPLMRNRFTLGDLLFFLQWDREALFQRAWEQF